MTPAIQGKMRPPIWQLIRNAIEHFGRDVSYSEIKQSVWAEYPDVNSSTLTCQIIICSVNHPSRVHYPENKKPRLCNGQYDFLYNTARGRAAPYDPERHGLWEIGESNDGSLVVRMSKEPTGETVGPSDNQQSAFALESHLRDYLARNLARIANFGVPLKVYTSEDGRDGVEFQTDVGPIDILATCPSGDFYVLELKLGRGADAALGQILRYMGWVDRHLSAKKRVFGVVLAADISEKLRYAATQVPQVRLMKYESPIRSRTCRANERIVIYLSEETVTQALARASPTPQELASLHVAANQL
ncbi:MAG: endonuclease NucS domain-containing protein [Pyrinomonadaceae bacterium]